MSQNFNFAQFLLAVVPTLLAITVHEAAHAYAARYWGDYTAEQEGRLTLNPLAHIDPVGTVIVPIVLILSSSPFLFGWARPAPIVSRNFRNVKLGWRTVAIAGPLSNLAMAFGWGLCAILLPYVPDSFQTAASGMIGYGITINIALFALNIIPIPPLDGGRFVDTFLPARWSVQYRKIEPYGFWILLLLLAANLLPYLIYPVYFAIYRIIRLLFGI